MPADILLDATGDVDIANGDLVMGYDDDALIQRLRTRIQDVQGEWFKDTTRGLDWFGSVLGKRSDIVRRTEFRRVILGTDGVAGIARLELTYEGTDRSLTVEFTAIKEDGGTLDVRFEDVLAGGG